LTLNYRQLIKKLEKQKTSLAKERDKFRELETECAMFAEECEDAMDNISRAIDSLSEMV